MTDYQIQIFDQLRSGALAGATRFNLSCGLTEFPLEILELADRLEILDLSGNQLSALPEEITLLRKLKILFLSDNVFTVFPSVLGRCVCLDIIGFKANKINHISEDALPPGLRWLILTNNQLTQLPKSIGTCVKLQKVMLAGNQLTNLPETMANCKRLELLRISANCFEELPSWLFSLPRLAWLALAGNPITISSVRKDLLAEIPWHELELEQQLGEGASGITLKARLLKGETTRDVAVKVFRGEVTSDGLPSDEMNVCIAAGQHVNRVSVLGRISDHPQKKQGLVFDLIGPSFRNLGGPPDFETCTRDTFKSGTTFSAQQILKMAIGIASAVVQLHERNIIHGDLYAHNILIDHQANPLLSDFGAAFVFDGPQKSAVERIEVRAFGCLLEDMMNQNSYQDKHSSIWEFLMILQQDCVQDTVAHRPDFVSIHERIRNIIDMEQDDKLAHVI